MAIIPMGVHGAGEIGEEIKDKITLSNVYS